MGRQRDCGHGVQLRDMAFIQKRTEAALLSTGEAYHVGMRHRRPFGACGLAVCAKARAVLPRYLWDKDDPLLRLVV